MAKRERRGGQYRAYLLEQRGQLPEEEPAGAFRIKFYICLCLFIGYVLLDYTNASFYSLDSNKIYTAVSEDMTADFDVEEAFHQMLDSVWVSEEDGAVTDGESPDSSI